MQNILKFQFTFFSVFQPFLGGLVAANVKVPGNFGNIVELLRVVDIDTSEIPLHWRGA